MSTRAIKAFLKLIFGLNLVGSPLVGVFTWSNNREWSKLERFLTSYSWEMHYSDLCQ